MKYFMSDVVLSVFRSWALLLLLVPYGISHASEYSVHVGPNGYAPYSIVERSGAEVVATGVIFDFLDAFEAKHPEYKRKLALHTRKRANVKMANGEEIDIMFNSSLFVSDKILKFYKFTRPFFTTKDIVITHKSSNLDYQSAQDLYGKNIGTIRGYSYGKFDGLIREGKIIDMRVDHHTQAIGMLEKKRIDAYFGNIFVSPHYIRQLGLNIDDFVFSDVPMYEFEFAFAVNKAKPDLYKKLDEYIGASIEDGSLDKILKKYIK